MDTTNKPVAWYKKDSDDYLFENIGQPDFQVQEFIDAGYVPLYTHPAKELTDEEIIDVWWSLDALEEYGLDRCQMDFARAILKKAQEK